ncbi:thioesterase BOA10 like protein [Verticillium longisporum]|uniref:Thioesterase BOA10 like protein n=1 Tax=Verticillium longisporum TaxID=100787 RepID=A0A8I2ZVJ6_VERLO|nr:thioesterase BOA10 like protein [Verticillium longisporum]
MLHPLCEVVQYPQHAAPGTTPLILIHDGGGTSFAYHCLDPLRRPVYAIANPHFHSGAPWPGGIREMAELYVAMVRRTVDSDDFPDNGAARARVLLGGWSFGGMLALEMARLLEGDDDIEVAGLLMVDSTFPLWKDYETANRKFGDMLVDDEDPPRKNVLLARQAMTAAVEMIQSWQLPQWPWQDDRPAEVGVNGYSATVPRVPGGPPPTVLLKATDGVPTKVAGEVSRVDLFRDQRDLGWGKYHPGFIGEVLDVDGHHYGLFDWARLSATTNKIKEACELLEKKPTWNEKRA